MDYPEYVNIWLPFNLTLRVNTSSSPANLTVTSSYPINGSTILAQWTHVTDSNVTFSNLIVTPPLADSFTLTVELVDARPLASLQPIRQVYRIQVRQTYMTLLAADGANVRTGVASTITLTAITSGRSIPVVVDLGDNSSISSVLNDTTIHLSKAFVYAGVYLIQVYGRGAYANVIAPANLTIQATGPPACSPPLLSIQNPGSLTNPSAYLRSNMITLTGITAFSCSFNYTNTKSWSLVKVDPMSGDQIGAPIDLTADSAAFSGYDQAILVIYPNSLDFGVYYLVYSAKIIYSMDHGLSFLTLNSQSSTHIQIVRSGLNIFGLPNGLLQQTYGTGQQIVLDPGSFSADMDKSVDPSTLSYVFYCQKVPSGQSTSAYFSRGGPITRLDSIPNMFQVYSSTFSSNCFASNYGSFLFKLILDSYFF